MSTVFDVADAVKASLNAGSFNPPFTAERHYQPAFKLPELKALRVSVVPKSVTMTPASRQDGFVDCAIDIGVQQKVDTNDAAQADALMGLVEQIGDHLRRKRLDSFPGAMWVSAVNEPIFAPEHLDQQHVLTSVLTVTYRVRR